MRVKNHGKGVAVRRCSRHGGGPDRAGSATFVFDNNTLPDLLRQGLCQQARHLVHRSARWKYGHQFDGLLGRPGLCLRVLGCRQQEGRRDGKDRGEAEIF